MSSETDLDVTGRVRVLEHSVHKLENRVDQGFHMLEKSMAKLTERLSETPRPIPFKEIAATIAVCLAIVAYAGNYLEGQYKKNVSTIEYRIEQLEKANARKN